MTRVWSVAVQVQLDKGTKQISSSVWLVKYSFRNLFEIAVLERVSYTTY